MDIKDLIKAGKLTKARSLLTAAIKSRPADTASRTHFFQVLLFMGDWDKAERHLDVISTQDAKIAPTVILYKSLIAAERERTEVTALRAMPSCMPEVPPWFTLHHEARTKLKEGAMDDAARLFLELEDQIPDVAGTVNGKEFVGFRDTDITLAHVLEIFAHDHYCWIPFTAIREVLVTPPKTLFDLLWTSVSVTTWGGLSVNGYLPCLYPGSATHEQDEIKMGRLTDWESLGPPPLVKAQGLHIFSAGGEDVGLLDIQEIQFRKAAGEKGEG